jgi:hypothetical protein
VPRFAVEIGLRRPQPLGRQLVIAGLQWRQRRVLARLQQAGEERARENEKAKREGRQTFPAPSTWTINRETTTPLRAIVRFSARQQWRSLIELEAVKPQEGEMPSPPPPTAQDADVDKLLQAIADALRAWRSRAQVYKAIDKLGRHWRPHESRRAVVTAVIKATGSPTAAQHYASHANIKTTLRYDRPDAVGPQVRAGGGRGRRDASR